MTDVSRESGTVPHGGATPWLVSLDTLARDARAASASRVGGKASKLAWLVRHGFDVPPAWVVPARAFEAVVRTLPPACEPRSLLRASSGRAVYARAAEARDAILAAELPARLAAELEALQRAEGDVSRWGFAVRSSATCEDGPIVSMAGLAESVLGVRDGASLVRAVKEVWASIASGRALEYLAARGVRDVAMAVVIQRMVPATAAGVMFTRHGSGAGRSARERVVNAGLGLGSPVVDGVTTPDLLTFDEEGTVTARTVAHKAWMLVVEHGGLVQTPTTSPDAPALHDGHVRALASVARRLESLEDVAWDVEFACAGEDVFVVQARRVTGLGFPEGGDATTVWSNANVGEALPGVATPLTWSVAGAYSEEGFRKAFGALGCSVPKHTRLVGNVHGRFYLNLTQFMRIAAQVPWLDPRALVELGGGSGGDELAGQVNHVSRKGFYARLPVTATRLLREQLRIDDQVTRFEMEAERALRAHLALDLAILPDDAVARTLRDVQDLLERTGDVMLTCASSALGAHVVLTHVLARVRPDAAEKLAQDLTRGIRDLESARPALGVLRVVAQARLEPEARAVLEREDATFAALPEGSTKRALQGFLDLFGDRAVREAELSTPRWRDDPRPVLATIRAALRSEAQDVERVLERARAAADADMRSLLPQLGRLEQTLVRHLVARAQKAARLRERMRGWVTRVLGMLRDAALEADRRLLRLSPDLRARKTGEVEAVFLLTIDEIVHALRTSRTDLGALVRARRAELYRDCARPDPPATFVGAPPSVQLPPSGGDLHRGIAASAGVVVGRARVLLSPAQMSELEPGEILVVHTTDVGWTPLFCVAAGVVTELGGGLSHAAVVARELGVPSVVNVDGITRALRTGEWVRVDGDRGVVERIAKP